MNQKTFVYLAGPIAGCTEAEAKNWRGEFQGGIHDKIAEQYEEAHDAPWRDIACISPLRCEPAVDGRYDLAGNGQDADPRFGSSRAIASKNLFDTKKCDMVVAYFPLTTKDLSIGTIMEVAWAHALGKPVILVAEDERIWRHPVIDSAASWKLRSLDDAVDVVVGILGDYS